MKKLLIAILILLLCFLFVSCAARNEQEQRVFYVCEGVTFVEVIKHSGNELKQPFTIFVHKETRVMYVKYSLGHKGAMTVMLDENGNPLLWEGEL